MHTHQKSIHVFKFYNTLQWHKTEMADISLIAIRFAANCHMNHSNVKAITIVSLCDKFYEKTQTAHK